MAIVLIAGTFALSSPSFIIKGVNAQAQTYYDIYSYDDRKSYDQRSYGNDYGYYESQYHSYGKDDRNKLNKDSSKSIDIKKIKCINTNLNINGNNAGNVSLGNKGQGADAAEGYLGAYSYAGSGGYDGEGYYDNGYNNNKKDKGSDCIINNNNTNINFGGNETTPEPPEPTTTTLTVTKLVTCQQVDGSGLVPSIQQRSANCGDLLALITEDQFNITVEDFIGSPSEFAGSETGTIVTLNPSNYTVTETPDDSVAAEVATLDDVQIEITGPFPSFSGDCRPAIPGPFEAIGTIAAGESQTCNIVNNFVITEEEEFTASTADSPIISQGTADSSELTALEKIEKLKQQWLDQLP